MHNVKLAASVSTIRGKEQVIEQDIAAVTSLSSTPQLSHPMGALIPISSESSPALNCDKEFCQWVFKSSTSYLSSQVVISGYIKQN